jgi:hypothetical protein
MFVKALLLGGCIIVSAAAYSQDVFEAARTGDLKRLKTLAKIDKDTVNAVDAQGFNPLMIACYRGQVGAAKLLIQKGADVNARSHEGSALQAACYTNNTELATLLVKKGADVHVKGPDGNNALMYAVLNQNEALVKLLVRNGADLSEKNNDGQTAHSLAMTQENKTIQELVAPAP